MTRVLPVAFAALAGVAGLAAPAGADPRFAPRPPVVLSPNLTEPWILQLRPNYRDMTDVPAPARRQPAALEAVEAPTVIQPLAINPDSDGTRERAAREETGSVRRTREVRAEFLPTTITYRGPHKPGTIVIDTSARYLYLVEEGGVARRYGVGVGRPGFEWAGEHRITRKAEWPSWRPPAEMLKRQPYLPRFMAGGPNNPLGARALYLGSSIYRIHGSNEPWTIGQAVSSGCIRMRNEDVVDLYGRVRVGTRVIVM